MKKFILVSSILALLITGFSVAAAIDFGALPRGLGRAVGAVAQRSGRCAPAGGWINAADGNLYRLWFFTFAEGFNKAPPSNACLGAIDQRGVRRSSSPRGAELRAGEVLTGAEWTRRAQRRHPGNRPEGQGRAPQLHRFARTLDDDGQGYLFSASKPIHLNSGFGAGRRVGSNQTV